MLNLVCLGQYFPCGHGSPNVTPLLYVGFSPSQWTVVDDEVQFKAAKTHFPSVASARSLTPNFDMISPADLTAKVYLRSRCRLRRDPRAFKCRVQFVAMSTERPFLAFPLGRKRCGLNDTISMKILKTPGGGREIINDWW